MSDNDDILTIQELSAWLKVAEKTLYSHVQKGLVPGFRVGTAWRFRRSEIEAWIERQRQLADESSRRQPTRKSTGE